MLPVEDAAVIPVIVATVVGVTRFKRLLPTLRGVAVLVICELFIEVLSRIVAAWQGTNLFILSIDTLLEFTLLAWVYRRALAPSTTSRWLGAVVVVFALGSLLTYLQPASFIRFNTLQRFVESLLVLSLTIQYFIKVIRELVIIRLERDPMFWVSVGLLVYFSSNVFIFISSNYVVQRSEALSMKLWIIHAILYMVLNSFYAVALWITPSTRK
jgi:hypothetical protein